MKKMRSLMAMVFLTGVLAASNVYAAGIIQSSPRPVSGYSVGSLFGEVYDYLAELFAGDEQTNDAGIIINKPKPQGDFPPTATNGVGIIVPSCPKPVGIIQGYTNDVGIINNRP